MSKHTPGPWYVGAMNDALFIIDKGPRPSTDYIRDMPAVNVIAKVCTLPDHTEDANARLIAAAPEMIEFIETLENDDGKIPEWLWKRRNELIRKAGGGA